jgi:flagellar biosynthesis/type III secretory pathway M-ring protein FliF/YscJ
LEDEAANSDYYSGHDIWDYLVGNLREQIVKDGFIIERASASIIINTDSLPDADVNAIIALASNASGIERAAITVQGMEFYRPIIQEDELITGRGLTFWFLAIGIPLLLICIILIIVLTAMARRRREQEAAMLELEDGEQQSLAELMGQEPEFEPIALVESSEQKLKLQIKDLAESDPEIVAQLIKVWLNA